MAHAVGLGRLRYSVRAQYVHTALLFDFIQCLFLHNQKPPCRQDGVMCKADRLTAGTIPGGGWPGKGKGRCSCALCCCSRITGLGSPVRACCPETSTPTSMGIACTWSCRSAHRCSRLFAPKHQAPRKELRSHCKAAEARLGVPAAAPVERERAGLA